MCAGVQELIIYLHTCATTIELGRIRSRCHFRNSAQIMEFIMDLFIRLVKPNSIQETEDAASNSATSSKNSTWAIPPQSIYKVPADHPMKP